MNTWYDYRAVWVTSPWLAVVMVLGLLMLVLGVIGTVTGSGFAFFFVPGVLSLFAHHFLVMRRLE